MPRTRADRVVTEHGVAESRGRSSEERTSALRAIPPPDFRGGGGGGTAPARIVAGRGHGAGPEVIRARALARHRAADAAAGRPARRHHPAVRRRAGAARAERAHDQRGGGGRTTRPAGGDPDEARLFARVRFRALRPPAFARPSRPTIKTACTYHERLAPGREFAVLGPAGRCHDRIVAMCDDAVDV